MTIIKMIFAGLLSSVLVTGIYDYNVPKIEGGSESLSASQGKKILIITLPTEQSTENDSLLYCLDTLAAARRSTLSVIGVPAYEFGYQPSKKTELQNWYRSKLGSYITVTEGLHVSKASNNQHGLFKWLTNIDLNGTFDMDIEGTGHKFFVNENGDLYGSLVPQTKIGGKTVQKTLEMQ